MPALTHFHEFGKHMGEAVHNFAAGHTFKVALTNTAPVAGTGTVLADITQIPGTNGYTTGGAAITGAAWAETGAGTGVWRFTGNDVVFTASGGSIGPFRYIAFYNDTPTSPADPLIGYIDHGSEVTITDGGTFAVDVTAAGIFTVTVP